MIALVILYHRIRYFLSIFTRQIFTNIYKSVRFIWLCHVFLFDSIVLGIYYAVLLTCKALRSFASIFNPLPLILATVQSAMHSIGHIFVKLAKIRIPRISLPKLAASYPLKDTQPARLFFIVIAVLMLVGANTFAADKINLSEVGTNIKSLVKIEPAAGGDKDIKIASSSSSSQEADNGPSTLNVEGVLVPRKSTVISSSRDGQIANINVDDGDIFHKGDVLIEYDCADLEAELKAVTSQTALMQKRSASSNKLYKMDIISDLERQDIKNEAAKALAQKGALEARMLNCKIIAGYDGRVVNRLANAHEYTRTDRVLLEVASLDNLEVEFLLPSIWLRWINVGAPVTLSLFETGHNYTAHISRIHGEVDPVSQSIQVTARLDGYQDPLLPGMSGHIDIDKNAIRDAGIKGYLAQPDPDETDLQSPPTVPSE